MADRVLYHFEWNDSRKTLQVLKTCEVWLNSELTVTAPRKNF